jgi:hypothetical protein
MPDVRRQQAPSKGPRERLDRVDRVVAGDTDVTKLENDDGSLPDHTEEMLRRFERDQKKRDAEAKRREAIDNATDEDDLYGDE